MPKIKILVVEDNPVNLELIRDLLETFDYEVVAAANGWEAVDRARAVLPDVILMDIQLPGIGGLEATRILKQDPLTAGIPVAAVSAFAGQADEARAREAGCEAFISKPINTREFPRRVADLLGERVKHDAARQR